MKALSLKPPWPYAIFHLGKDIENRNWRTSYRGPLLIHASKTWDQDGYEFLKRAAFMTPSLGGDVPTKNYHIFGAIIGIVDLVGCVDQDDMAWMSELSCKTRLQLSSRWFFGPFGFVFENPREFKKPIPWRGQLGLFDVPISSFMIPEFRKNIGGGEIA